jgi:hypothetical protein
MHFYPNFHPYGSMISTYVSYSNEEPRSKLRGFLLFSNESIPALDSPLSFFITS